MINLPVCQPLSTLVVTITDHPAAGPTSSKYCMRIEYYTANGKYTLLVDGRLILYTSSKSVADYWYTQASAHSSTSSKPYRIPVRPPYTRS